MDRQIYKILNNYSLGKIEKVEELNKGNTSNPYKIVSEQGIWILRSLKNETQAISEYIAADILSKYKVCPQIVKTIDQSRYLKYDEVFYNLQEYIEGIPIENKPDTFSRLGEAVGIWHSKLAGNVDILEVEDRFELESMWKQLNEKNENINNQIKNILPASFLKDRDLECFIDEMASYQNSKIMNIHADLGKWNMINTLERIFIIDFGEIRKGDNHLDAAAALTSMFSIKDNEDYIYRCLINFNEAYTKYVKDFNWAQLSKNVQLWTIRGIIAVLLYCDNEKNHNGTIKTIKNMTEIENKIECVINSKLIKRRI